MTFDVGGAIATALAAGVVYGIVGQGSAFITQRYETWKHSRWEEEHKHLPPDQLQFARDNLVATTKKKKTKRLIFLAAIFSGSLVAIEILWG